MKKIFNLCAAFLMLSASVAFKTAEPKKVLTITIKNVKDIHSPIMIGVFNAASEFPNKTLYRKYMAVPSGNHTAVVYVTDLEYGTYAVSMFQDKNKDYRLNTNVIGIPVEPYAFSNNFKPKFSAPDFSDCVFKYNEGYHVMTINLLQ